MEYTKDFLQNICNKHTRKIDVMKELNWKIHGTAYTRFNFQLTKLQINTDHFDSKSHVRKHIKIITKCLMCHKEFETLSGGKHASIYCSYSCSNKNNASGSNNRHYIDGRSKEYRTHRSVCFENWTKECSLCDWNLSIDVHHIDGNHNNNCIFNLIPLCKNHHSLTIIKKYKHGIKIAISEANNKKWITDTNYVTLINELSNMDIEKQQKIINLIKKELNVTKL